MGAVASSIGKELQRLHANEKPHELDTNNINVRKTLEEIIVMYSGEEAEENEERLVAFREEEARARPCRPNGNAVAGNIRAELDRLEARSRERSRRRKAEIREYNR